MLSIYFYFSLVCTRVTYSCVMDYVKKLKLSVKEKKDQLAQLMAWVTEQIQMGYVPKFSEIIDYAYRILKFYGLSRANITRELRLHPAYLMNSSQARKKFKGGKHRPIVVNNLGHLHGDIGFYAITSKYSTPLEKRSGFLVCKDILSRFTYVSVLKRNRTADSMINAFRDIFAQFRKQNPGLKVLSLGFDQERSVMSHKVQAYFKKKQIAFHPFSNTSSKSKFAENVIRLIRTTNARLEGNIVKYENIKEGELRWWILIVPAVVKTLNHRPIEINQKFLKFSGGDLVHHPYYTPADVNSSNLKDFLLQIEKANAAYYFAQFDLSTRGVKFQFNVGDYVRPKLIVISSEVIGNKRSEKSLSDEIFVVLKQNLFLSKSRTIERFYLVKSLDTGKQEEYSEDEIALTVGPI